MKKNRTKKNTGVVCSNNCSRCNRAGAYVSNDEETGAHVFLCKTEGCLMKGLRYYCCGGNSHEPWGARAKRAVVYEAPGTPETTRAHLRELHEFVTNIMRYCDNPLNWPLTHREQAAFVRMTLTTARKLRNSEGFAAMAEVLTAEDLAMGS